MIDGASNKKQWLFYYEWSQVRKEAPGGVI